MRKKKEKKKVLFSNQEEMLNFSCEIKEFKEEEEEKQKHKKEESSDTGGSNVGCGSVLLCFLFLFFAIWFTMMVDSLLK